jgi:hypothetical protein
MQQHPSRSVCIRRCSTSVTTKNEYGERGSPWRRPRLHRNQGTLHPLTRITDLEVLSGALIHEHPFSKKSQAWNISCRLLQFTVPKALANSSFMTKAGAQRLWLHWMTSNAWMNVSLPESMALPRASCSRHRTDSSRHRLCREGTLGNRHSAPLGRQRVLCREPKDILLGKTCLRLADSRQRAFSKTKKSDPPASGSTGRPPWTLPAGRHHHHSPHYHLLLHLHPTTPPPPSPPLLASTSTSTTATHLRALALAPPLAPPPA